MKRWLLAIGMLTAACTGETAPPPAEPDAGPPNPNAPNICRELGDKIATAIAQTCNQDKQKNYDDFLAQAQCDRVTNIRDEKELREKCFKDLERSDLSCPSLRGGAIPLPCRAQLIRPR